MLIVAAPAWAKRPSCMQVAAAQAGGWSDAEVAAAFRTTRVRVHACQKLLENRARLASRREAFRLQHAERTAR